MTCSILSVFLFTARSGKTKTNETCFYSLPVIWKSLDLGSIHGLNLGEFLLETGLGQVEGLEHWVLGDAQ